MKLIFLTFIAFTTGILSMSINFVYGESDFVLEMNNAGIYTGIYSVKLTLFAIEGESYREICPSGNCTFTLDLIPYNPQFNRPQPHRMDMSGYFFFTLKDNVDNPNIGAKKQEFLEKFLARFSCTVEDIIEDNGQEIYICNSTSHITREFDSREWDCDTNAIFDAKNNIVKVYGNYTGR